MVYIGSSKYCSSAVVAHIAQPYLLPLKLNVVQCISRTNAGPAGEMYLKKMTLNLDNDISRGKELGIHSFSWFFFQPFHHRVC